MLGRLGLQFLGRTDVRDQGHVNMGDVAETDVVAELADGLQERQDLDVAHRSPDLGDDDVHVVAVPQPQDPVLDLVGDVGDDLHRVPQVVAAALLVQNRQVHRSGGDVAVPPQALAREALVVAQIQVGLAAVVGDVDLPVLEGVHRAGVDVDVGVELLVDDPQPAGLHEPPQRGGGDPLAETGDHSPGHEHILRHGITPYQTNR